MHNEQFLEIQHIRAPVAINEYFRIPVGRYHQSKGIFLIIQNQSGNR